MKKDLKSAELMAVLDWKNDEDRFCYLIVFSLFWFCSSLYNYIWLLLLAYCVFLLLAFRNVDQKVFANCFFLHVICWVRINFVFFLLMCHIHFIKMLIGSLIVNLEFCFMYAVHCCCLHLILSLTTNATYPILVIVRWLDYIFLSRVDSIINGLWMNLKKRIKWEINIYSFGVFCFIQWQPLNNIQV